MKFYIVAGESSGDMHGANLLNELKSIYSNVQVRGMGGDKLKQAGMELFTHYRETNFMGFVEVAKHLGKILRAIKSVKKDILEFKPDVVILIDFPGFNLRLAKFCREKGIKVVYYISPQIWAWKSSRVHQIKRNVDLMITILPFEKDFYKKYGMNVSYVGHPLLDEIERFISDHEWIQNQEFDEKKVIALLPGSRKMEIHNMLPTMVKLAENYKGIYRFIIAGAPSISIDFYKSIIKDAQIEVMHNKTYSLLSNSYAAIVTSGTATLETALFNVPQVVCYKGSPISYYIARRLVKVHYISLVNLILNKPAVKELIQFDFNIDSLKEEFDLIIGTKRDKLFEDYKILKELLGNSGASKKAALEIKTFLT